MPHSKMTESGPGLLCKLSDDLRLAQALPGNAAREHLPHNDAVRVDVRLFAVLLGELSTTLNSEA